MSALIYRPAGSVSIRQAVHVRRSCISPEERQSSVCFTGHRQLSAEEKAIVSARLDQLLEQLYTKGYHRFFCGGALGFDTLAAEAVIRLQAKHGDVRLIMAIPCSTQAQRWNAEDTRRYERILYAADETHVLSPAYYNGCMMVRNRFMVDRSSICVCYLNKMKGGTMSTVAYALREKLPVINVAMADSNAARCATVDEVTDASSDPDDSPRS